MKVYLVRWDRAVNDYEYMGRDQEWFTNKAEALKRSNDLKREHKGDWAFCIDPPKRVDVPLTKKKLVAWLNWKCSTDAV